MKNRIVKKIMRTLLLVIIFTAVGGTFYFLWQKAQPVITVYEIVTPTIGNVETKAVATGNVEPVTKSKLNLKSPVLLLN